MPRFLRLMRATFLTTLIMALLFGFYHIPLTKSNAALCLFMGCCVALILTHPPEA